MNGPGFYYDTIEEDKQPWDTTVTVNYRIILPAAGTLAQGFPNAQDYSWCFDNIARQFARVVSNLFIIYFLIIAKKMIFLIEKVDCSKLGSL